MITPTPPTELLNSNSQLRKLDVVEPLRHRLPIHIQERNHCMAPATSDSADQSNVRNSLARASDAASGEIVKSAGAPPSKTTVGVLRIEARLHKAKPTASVFPGSAAARDNQSLRTIL
jgi:hypothetical protein